MTKKPPLILGILAIIILAVFFVSFRGKKSAVPENIISSQKFSKPTESAAPDPVPDIKNTNSAEVAKNSNGFLPPLEKVAERVTKKKFGDFITPQNSPVQPERFSGYHTGTDFEIFPEETDAEVPVKAVCDGKLALKKTASGYGGVAVQNCMLGGSPVTAIYGHLKISSIKFNAGENISAGDTLGILGKGFSSETDGERKHLHLGFHRGAAVNILGYVQNQTELSGWIDPCLYVCGD